MHIIKSISCLLLLLPHLLPAQKEANIWYFGDKAGIDFNTNPPSALTNSKMITEEGCASIADTAGNLLFYTDGLSVWNRDHAYMDGYNNILNGHQSSTHSAMIVRQPGSMRYYYVFTIDAFESQDNNKGLCYSIVDMEGNGGLGTFILQNKFLFRKPAEKMAAVRHANKRDIWIAGVQCGNDSFYVYRLTDQGLSTQVIRQNTGMPMAPFERGPAGYMKFSRNGAYVAYCDYAKMETYVMNFDNQTGRIGNLRKTVKSQGYGIEFSPNGKYLYYYANDKLRQAPLDKLLSNSFSDTDAVAIGPNGGFAMQLAPDGKIYCAQLKKEKLSVIHFPDRKGIACSYKDSGIALKGTQSLFGLPTFHQSAIYPEYIESADVCWRDSSSFILKNAGADSVRWIFDDGATSTVRGDAIKHRYRDSGTYKVKAVAFINARADTFYTSVKVLYAPLLFGKDTVLCTGETIILNAYHPSIQKYWWSNGTTDPAMSPDILGAYSLRVQYENGCMVSDTILISEAPRYTVYLGSDTAFCKQFTMMLKAGNGFKSYRWNTGDSAMEISVNSEGMYAVKVLDTNKCPYGDTINVNAIDKPALSISPDTSDCGVVILSVAARSDLQYIWSTGDTGYTIRVRKSGPYHLTARHRFCSMTDTLQVAIPAPEVDLGPDTLLCSAPILLRTSETGKYLWNTGHTGPSLAVNKEGTYWLRVSRYGCESLDTVEIGPCLDMLYYIPDAFSPNGDQVNDVFKVHGSNITHIQMQIYNRWGEKIFESAGREVAWDGLYKGYACPQDVYFYSLNIVGYKDGSWVFRSGMVTVLR